MENASKALIIAGAILLSILIIGLAMYVFGQASEAMQGVNMDPQKVQAYNSQFEQYEGTKSGTQARTLYNLIRNHNNGNRDDASLQISLTISDKDLTGDLAKQAAAESSDKVTFDSNTLKAGKTYKITFAYDPSSGYITACNMRDTNNKVEE